LISCVWFLADFMSFNRFMLFMSPPASFSEKENYYTWIAFYCTFIVK